MSCFNQKLVRRPLQKKIFFALGRRGTPATIYNAYVCTLITQHNASAVDARSGGPPASDVTDVKQSRLEFISLYLSEVPAPNEFSSAHSPRAESDRSNI